MISGCHLQFFRNKGIVAIKAFINNRSSIYCLWGPVLSRMEKTEVKKKKNAQPLPSRSPRFVIKSCNMVDKCHAQTQLLISTPKLIPLLVVSLSWLVPPFTKIPQAPIWKSVLLFPSPTPPTSNPPTSLVGPSSKGDPSLAAPYPSQPPPSSPPGIPLPCSPFHNPAARSTFSRCRSDNGTHSSFISKLLSMFRPKSRFFAVTHRGYQAL